MCEASDVLRRAAVTAPPRKSAQAAYGRREPFRCDEQVRLVLLGTGGGGNPKATRAGYANAVVVGGDAYLVDCGETVARQAWTAGIGTNIKRTPPGGQRFGRSP